MNFIETFKEGQQGANKGLPMGIDELDKSLDGIQRKTTYSIASSPKVGKSTFVDFSFVINPYLYSLKHPEIEVDWTYFSFEIDRVKKEFKFASFFMYNDFGVQNFEYKGNKYLMSPRYLLGRLKDEEGNQIPVSKEHQKMLQEIHQKRIIPLFGDFNKAGKQIKKGKITFIEDRDNPTGIRNFLLKEAEDNGQFIKEPYKVKIDGKVVTKQRIAGYKPNNSNKMKIVILDHVRLMKRERGFTMKDNIDKMSQYEVELRNWCGYTFVNVIHLNRSLTNVDRMRYMEDRLFPTAEDIKDSGNLSEDSDVIITLFNPQDEKYNLNTHFGLPLDQFPNYRSLHVVESRDTICPAHFKTNMYGNINVFEDIDIDNNY